MKKNAVPTPKTLNKLVRRASGLMALEQRFMFDGAAVGDAVDKAIDLQVLAPAAIAPSESLAQAEVRAERLVTEFLAQPNVRDQLLTLFKGGQTGAEPTAEWQAAVDQLIASAKQGDLTLRVELRSNDELQGAKGAFSATGTVGEATLYINADWLATADSASVTKVLVEEMGHYLDSAINGGADTAGDEGEIFARVVVDRANPLSMSFLSEQNDHVTLNIDGQSVLAEMASFNFVNAYEMVYDLDSDNVVDVDERLADKEQNSHYFNATLSLGAVRISDGNTTGVNFSGNDVSAVALRIGNTSFNGWISRPIKSGGIVRGFYFWTDAGFVDRDGQTGLYWAQQDNNQDGDSNSLDNRGFLLVVDQKWFDEQIAAPVIASRSISNTKDGNLGTITIDNIGSSSDRVDSALNSLLVPNTAPTAANDQLTVTEDSGTTTVSAANGLLSNDSDINNDALTITGYTVSGIVGTQTTGTTLTISNVGDLRINADGSYTFAPALDYNGPVPPITYTVSDGNGGTKTAVLSITVTPVNDPPVSTDDSVNVVINTPKVLSVNDLGTYGDPENDPFTSVKITALPTSGTLEYWNGTTWATLTGTPTVSITDILKGNLRYVPATDTIGSPTLQFQVYDGSLYSTDFYTLTLNIAGNLAPSANADTKSVAEAGCSVAAAPATGNVITDGTDDSDTDGGTLVISNIVAYGNSQLVIGGTTSTDGTAINGQYGTLTIGANGTYSYVPNNSLSAIEAMNSGDTKTETFTYTVSDGQGGTASATLTITINGTNDAPTGADDFSAFIEEANASTGNHGTVTGNALTNDSDVDNTNGQLTVKLIDGSTPPAGTTTTINLNASSPISSVTATATDAGGFTWSATIDSSFVGPVYVSFDTGSTWQLATETDGGNLLVKKLSPSTLEFSDNVALYGYQNAQFKYTDPARSRTALWTVSLSNPVVTSGNEIYTSSAEINNIQVGDTVTYSGSTGTIKVTALDTTTGAITLDNDNNPSTAYSVGLTNVALTFSRTTGGIATTATQEYYQGAHGYLILNQNGSYTYTLTTDLSATQVIDEQFTYHVVDPADGCLGTAKINIQVTGVDAPKLSNDTLVVYEDSGIHKTFNDVASGTDLLSANDSNGTSITLGDIVSFKVAGDITTYTAEPLATGDSATNKATIAGVGTLRIHPDGSISFDPVDNYIGLVPTVTYTRTGNNAVDYIANLTITIESVDDASVLAVDTQSVPEDTTATGNVLTNDSDVDSILSVASFTVSGMAGTKVVNSALTITDTNGTVGSLTLNANGSYTFTPAANWNGTVPVITYTTNTGLTSTLTITVTPANDPPTLDLYSSGTGTGWNTTYMNQGTGVSIGDTDVLINDIDDTNIETAVIVLTNPQSGDVLSIGGLSIALTTSGTMPSGTLSSGIAYTTTNTNGVITISLSGSYSLADYQDAIEGITFSSSGVSTVDRVVSVKINDGNVDSNTAFTTIDVSPDNLAVTVLGTIVNEASPYVMFAVTGVEGQWVSLELGNTGSGTGHASMGTDFLPNLQYFDGSDWVNYTGGLVQIPNTVSDNGKMLVRTAVLQDSVWESTIATYETLKLTAKNAAGTENITSDVANTQADGTSQIRDDGQGSIYLSDNNGAGNALSPNVSGNTGYPAYLDDDRPVTINSISVNEGSPKAVFTVTGYTGQVVRFDVSNGNAISKIGSGPTAIDGTEDYGPDLQILIGGTWTNYTAGADYTLTGATTYLRTAVIDDDPFEGQHAFFLSVTQMASGQKEVGIGNIYDDGTGSYWIADNTTESTSSERALASVTLDDDRTLTINSPLVNEASDYVVFTITGNSGQTVTLQLEDESSNGTVTGKANILENQTLKIWDGLSWVDYDANNLPTFNDNGKIFVRVDIVAEQDSPYEGGETFKLNATLSGQSNVVTGVATIIDDGTGVKFPGTFTSGSPTTNTTSLDNDQSLAITVTGGNYNEKSPRAVFTVNATAGQLLTLDVQNDAQLGKAPTGDNEGKPNDSLDTAAIYYSLDGGATWELYTGPVTAGAVPVLVAIDITNERDDVYEGEEQLKLVVTSGGQAASGFSSIFDDGTGTVTKPITDLTTNDTGANDPAVAKDDDRVLAVTNVTVNEGSPYVVFTVTGGNNQQATLSLANQNADGANLSTLQYFDGTWQNYTANQVVSLSGSGSLLVRVALSPEQETAIDNGETFNLVATNTGGTVSTGGLGTIKDDGTGDYFDTNNNTATPAVPAGVVLDDDRPITVTGGNYNENSPRAVFTVNANPGQLLTLDVQNDAQPGKAPTGDNEGKPNDSLDTAAIYYSLDGGATWELYTGPVTAGAVPVLVAIDITNERDDVYEGEEQLKLVVTSGGQAASGFSSIFDDGTGTVTKPITDLTTNDTGANDPTVVKDDDRPKPAPVVLPPEAPAPKAAAPLALPPEPSAPALQAFSSEVQPLAPRLVPVEAPVPIGDILTSSSGFRVAVNETASPGLALNRGITDQFVEGNGSSAKVSMPFDAFIHSNKDAVIKLDAKQADNSPLPGWVRFDPATGSFEVNPPKEFKGKLDLKVVALDDDGREAVAIFQLFVGDKPAEQKPQSRNSLTEKLRLAGQRPITLIKLGGEVTTPAPAREVSVRAAEVQRATAG